MTRFPDKASARPRTSLGNSKLAESPEKSIAIAHWSPVFAIVPVLLRTLELRLHLSADTPNSAIKLDLSTAFPGDQLFTKSRSFALRFVEDIWMHGISEAESHAGLQSTVSRAD